MIIKPRISNIDVLMNELLKKTEEFRNTINTYVLDGYRSDNPIIDTHTYLHRTGINRENRDILEVIRRIQKLSRHLENSEKGLNMIGDILLTMLEISEDASAVYIGEVNPKFIEHNVHLKRLKDEFYSVINLYKTGELPVFVTVNSNSGGVINVDYDIHLDSNNTTRLYYETPKVMDRTTGENGLAANRPTLSLERLSYNGTFVYTTPNVVNGAINVNIYATNIDLIEECVARVDNYKLELKMLSHRLDTRRTQLEGMLNLNRDRYNRDIKVDNRDLEESISKNRFLMKKTEYNI